MNEEWPRAFPDLPHLLENRFYLVDWHDGWADANTYNQTRSATQLAEPRAAFVRSGGQGHFASLLDHDGTYESRRPSGAMASLRKRSELFLSPASHCDRLPVLSALCAGLLGMLHLSVT